MIVKGTMGLVGKMVDIVVNFRNPVVGKEHTTYSGRVISVDLDGRFVFLGNAEVLGQRNDPGRTTIGFDLLNPNLVRIVVSDS